MSVNYEIGHEFKTYEEGCVFVAEYNQQCDRLARVLGGSKNEKIDYRCIHVVQAIQRVRKSSYPTSDEKKKAREECNSICQHRILAPKQKSTGFFKLTKFEMHTCNGIPQSKSGSRRDSFTTKMLARKTIGSGIDVDVSVKDSCQISDSCIGRTSTEKSYDEMYRISKRVKVMKYGAKEDQFNCLIARLEDIKKHDPDNVIFVKLFQDLDDDGNFALRFGAVVVVMGTAIRRYKAGNNGALIFFRLILYSSYKI